MRQDDASIETDCSVVQPPLTTTAEHQVDDQQKTKTGSFRRLLRNLRKQMEMKKNATKSKKMRRDERTHETDWQHVPPHYNREGEA